LNPFEAIAGHIVGPRFARACTLALISAQVGVATAYVNVIAASLHAALGIPRRSVLLALWGTLSAAGLLRSLSEVSWLAAAGLACYATVCASLLLHAAPQVRSVPLEVLASVDWRGFGWWYGICMFAFEGIGCVLPILEEMRCLDEPSKFIHVVHRVYGAALALYCAVGAMGCLAYRGATAEVILDNFPLGPLTSATQCAMVVMMLFSAAVQLYPIHLVADHLSLRRTTAPPGRAEGASDLPRSWAHLGLLRCAVASLPCATAYLVPRVSTVVDLVGSLSFSFLGVIAPAAMYWKLFRAEVSPSVRVLLGLLVAAGVLGGAFGALSPVLLERAA